MPSVALLTSEATRARIERNAGELSRSATQRMDAGHDWYRQLSAEDRSWVGLVAQAGIGSFIEWLRSGGTSIPGVAIFGSAPRELTRSVSLRQTLDLVRTVVDVVEADVTGLAEPGEEAVVREAVLRFSGSLLQPSPDREP